MLRLEGFDGPLQEREEWDDDERSTLRIAGCRQSIRKLVCMRRYDVCHTMECPRGRIVDLLVLAELSPLDAVFAATLFLAMESVCDGTVTSSTKRRAKGSTSAQRRRQRDIMCSYGCVSRSTVENAGQDRHLRI
ncbi:hypothetical protein C8J57DRAFT_1522456 [Mycena rebaudengoi]|nr:hypothetical protein C8J57DRAFT_1522456 [Mycena rebaudengoi]